ncbi:MAG: hypothetical protein JSW15_07275, partial [Deltaproteobacteria bacterium]
FAFGYDAVIRLSFGATSRRSATIVYAFIHGQAHGLLRRRIKIPRMFLFVLGPLLRIYSLNRDAS